MDIFNISKFFLFNNFNIFFGVFGLILTFSTTFAAYDYLDKDKYWYYVLNIIYVLGFFIVITTNNWFAFIIGWELVTVATTFMIIWSNKRIAKQYFLIQFIGSSILLYVMLLAYSMGYNTIGVIKEGWLQNLFVIGVGMKSGIFGLHFWLPPVHSRAPAPVSGVLSGWVVKLGFITLLKLIAEPNMFLIILGLLMIFYGGIKALLQTDLKVLLAYSTISQLGFIAIGIGSGTVYGEIGAIIHIVAHGLAKTNLFINSGFLEKEYHSRIIYNMHNFWEKNKVSAISVLISLLSLMGTFFLIGYHSKHFVKYGFKNIFIMKIFLHGASILTILYSLRLIWWLWAKNLFEKGEKLLKSKKINYKLDISGSIAIIFLSLSIVFTGIFPAQILNNVLLKTVEFHFLDGILSYLAYLLIAVTILLVNGGFRTKDSKPPSLDVMFETVSNYLYYFSSKSLNYDTGVFFESHLYNFIYRGARRLYKIIYTDFQVQLLWIPILLLILYSWISLIF